MTRLTQFRYFIEGYCNHNGLCSIACMLVQAHILQVLPADLLPVDIILYVHVIRGEHLQVSFAIVFLVKHNRKRIVIVVCVPAIPGHKDLFPYNVPILYTLTYNHTCLLCITLLLRHIRDTHIGTFPPGIYFTYDLREFHNPPPAFVMTLL